jgi:hypothetical protein
MRRVLCTVLLGVAALGLSATPAHAVGDVNGRVELRCRPVLSDPPPEHASDGRLPAVQCAWSSLRGLHFSSYRLVRVDAGGGGTEQGIILQYQTRTIIVQNNDPNQTTALDRRVRFGHAYAYRLLVMGDGTEPFAMSNLVTVRVPA